MKILFMPLHVITTGTRDKIAKDAKTKQRIIDKVILNKLLNDNREMALVIQGAMKTKNKTKKQPKKRVRSSSLKLRQNSAKHSLSERSPNMDEEKKDDTVEENQTEDAPQEAQENSDAPEEKPSEEPTRAGMQESPAPAAEEVPDEDEDDDFDDDANEGR